MHALFHLLVFFFFFLAASGLSCGTQDLSLWCMGLGTPWPVGS